MSNTKSEVKKSYTPTGVPRDVFERIQKRHPDHAEGIDKAWWTYADLPSFGSATSRELNREIDIVLACIQ